jgi:CIC family chloride channel protein
MWIKNSTFAGIFNQSFMKWLDKLRYSPKKILSEQGFIYFASILIGVTVGLVAFVLKTSVHSIRMLVSYLVESDVANWGYLIYPFIGIALAVLFTKYVLRRPVSHGIPAVLHAISKNQGFIKSHNLFSSIVTSSLTVGFGGSVGLEGPTVATSAAYGSFFGRFFKMRYKQRILFLGAASAGAMAAIFKAPIAAIVFAVEVIMLDLTMASIVPLLFASFSAYITSYFLMGKDVLYPFTNTAQFEASYIPWIILLGVLSGLLSVYFAKVYLRIHVLFDRIKNIWSKLLVGGFFLGVLIFLFPSLYGEGYESVNMALNEDYSYLFEKSLFFDFQNNFWITMLLIFAIVMLKIVATSVTFGSGGVGGIFAPSLFMGVNFGLFFALIVNHLFDAQLPVSTFALIGMGGLIAGVLHAPLTAMFLIADLTSGYQMLVPLMIVVTVSYTTVRYFMQNSVYTFQLAERGELLTHHADKNALKLLEIGKLIETNFAPVYPYQTLGELVRIIKESTRNVFPVLDYDNNFLGLVTLDDVRQIMFDVEMYHSITVQELMFTPVTYVNISDTMETVAHKIQSSGRFNLAVLDNGKYVGFVSRANVFSAYRSMLQKFSED